MQNKRHEARPNWKHPDDLSSRRRAANPVEPLFMGRAVWTGGESNDHVAICLG